MTDFLDRQVNFQYDTLGHLVAVVGPSITRGANNNANTFPNGTAYVFQYDVTNPRPARQNDLIRIWYPNQVAPFIDSTRTVNVASVYASATPRKTISYYNDPTDAYHYGKVQQVTESASGVGSIGAGAWGFMYSNSSLPANLINPADPIVSQTIVTDRNGNQTVYSFNASQMVVSTQRFATRGKNSLQAASWTTWTSYSGSAHNQPTVVVVPEGNSVKYAYEDETNTIQFGGVPYGRRIGLLRSVTRLAGNSIGIPSRPGSNGQNQLTNQFFYVPLFQQQCASIEPRGNPIDNLGTFFTPQNGGTTPTSANRSRYATTTFYDYQKDTVATVQADTVLQGQLGLTATQIGSLITFVGNQMNVPTNQGPLPAGFQMGIGDVNGEGTGNGTAIAVRHQGCVVQVQYPSVLQLVPNTGGGNPWVWQTQVILELYTSNARGQQTTYTDPEGNLIVYVRFPENDPEGGQQYINPTLSNKQYGWVSQTIVDADPATVMSLVGTDGDLITFIGNKITRTNTPGVYQNLVTRHQGGGGSGCSSCAYDALGNSLSTTDPRGFTTTVARNELGEPYRTTTDAPYSQSVETYYDANRNVTRMDTQDLQVLYDSTDLSDPRYAHFTPSGSGSVANLPTQSGPGKPGTVTYLRVRE